MENIIATDDLAVEQTETGSLMELALQKENVTDRVIAQLKDKYGGLKLKSLDDKEGYLEIRDARKNVRSVGILAERVCKKGREDAIATQRLWLAKEKEVLEKIYAVQTPLDEEMKKYEAEQDRKQQKEQKRIEQQNMQRQQILFRLGANFIDGCFVLNHISYDATLVKQADEDIWENTIIPKYKAQFEIIETERIAQENKRKEEAERLKKQEEELAQKKREFEEEQRKFREQQEESDRQKRLQQMREEEQRASADRERFQQRITPILSFGVKYDDLASIQDITSMPDAEWEKLYGEITPMLTKRKEEQDEKKRQEIAEQERHKLIEEQNHQAQLRQQEEEQKQRDLDSANDKTKWTSWIRSFSQNVPVPPTFKSPAYRTKAAIAREKIEEIKNL